MNEENTKYLIEKYPQLWGKIRFGQFECGDGWVDLIESVSIVLGDKARYDDFVIVKEKFGGLVIQGLLPVEEDEGGRIEWGWLRGVLSVAEVLSYRICEACGHPGKRRRGGYIRVLCDECEETRRRGRPSALEKLAKAADLEQGEAVRYLGDLLAVIHRDGGQYIEEHGWDKACEDAVTLSSRRFPPEEEK